MLFETENLIIRRFLDSDVDDFKKLIIDKMNSKYSKYDKQFPIDDERLNKVFDYFRESNEFYGVEIKEKHKIIGFISLNYIDNKTRNLGYCLHSDYHHQGLGKEMICTIINYAKDVLKLEKLVAGTAEENIPSVKLLHEAGFKVVNKELTSFTKDEKGNLITFVGCMFEINL